MPDANTFTISGRRWRLITSTVPEQSLYLAALCDRIRREIPELPRRRVGALEAPLYVKAFLKDGLLWDLAAGMVLPEEAPAWTREIAEETHAVLGRAALDPQNKAELGRLMISLVYAFLSEMGGVSIERALDDAKPAAPNLTNKPNSIN